MLSERMADMHNFVAEDGKCFSVRFSAQELTRMGYVMQWATVTGRNVGVHACASEMFQLKVMRPGVRCGGKGRSSSPSKLRGAFRSRRRQTSSGPSASVRFREAPS